MKINVLNSWKRRSLNVTCYIQEYLGYNIHIPSGQKIVTLYRFEDHCANIKSAFSITRLSTSLSKSDVVEALSDFECLTSHPTTAEAAISSNELARPTEHLLSSTASDRTVK